MSKNAASTVIEATKAKKSTISQSQTKSQLDDGKSRSAMSTIGTTCNSVNSGLPKGINSTVKVEKQGSRTKTTRVNTTNNIETVNSLPADISKQMGMPLGFDPMMLQQQMKAAASAPGLKGKRPVFVVICNETKVKKRKIKKSHGKKKKSANAAGADGLKKDDDDDESGSDRKNAKELPDAEHAHDGYDNLEPLQEGAVVPGAIAAKGPVGVVIVPIDKKENEKAPFAETPDKAIRGYLRKSPDGTPVFIPEDKMPKGKEGKPEKQQNCHPGWLIKGPHNEALFVPDGINVDKETGILVKEKIIGPDGKEVKVDDVGADTPISGYIKLRKDGIPVFVKKDIDTDDSKIAVDEKLPPNACNGVLVKDGKGCTTFVFTDPNGVGAVPKADKKEKGKEEKEEIAMMPPVGAVTGTVVHDKNGVPRAIPYDAANPDKSAKSDGFIVQAANGPVYIPSKKMEEHGKKANEDLKVASLLAVGEGEKRPRHGYNPDPDAKSVPIGVPGALHSFMADSKDNQQRATLANQITRSKDEGKTLKEVQKEDFEREKEFQKMVEQRRQLLEEHRKYLECRSAAINALPAYR